MNTLPRLAYRPLVPCRRRATQAAAQVPSPASVNQSVDGSGTMKATVPGLGTEIGGSAPPSMTSPQSCSGLYGLQNASIWLFVFLLIGG